MKRLALLTAAALLAAACGDAGQDAGTTAPPVTAATTTTATTAPPVVTTTTTMPPTTTSVPVTTTAVVADVSGYVVTGVADDDVLNVREGPGVEHPIVAELPPGATGVATTGFASGEWWEVQIDDGTGWVNSTFLGLPPSLTDGFDARPCNAPPSAELEGQLSDADHLLAQDHLVGDDCERFVFLLGNGAFGYGPLWPFNPDPVVPQGMEVVAEERVITVTLPPQVDLVRPTTTEADYGDALVFVVAREDRRLDVKLHFEDPVEAQVFAVHDPARIVVDVRRVYTDEGGRHLPWVGGQTAVLAIDPIDEGVVLPVTIRGYGRPFEAQGDIELFTFDGELGVGEPVEATWDGIAGVVTDIGTGYMTTEWGLTWGAFEVTLLDVPAGPGLYQLFVGEVLPDDEGTRSGVYIPLSLGE